MIKHKWISCFLFTAIILLALSVCGGWAEEIALTSDSYHRHNPQWSLDGNWIVYEKWDTTVAVRQIVWQIYKIPAFGGEEILITSDNTIYYGPSQQHPQWSPDGNWIVYNAGDEQQICKIPSAGGEEIALTSGDYQQNPQWSLDGNWIVYSKTGKKGRTQIYKVPASGGEEIAITSDNFHHYEPQWSPEGNWIVYSKFDATGYSQIYKVPASGGKEIALTCDSLGSSNNPQWSPDGNWILYQKAYKPIHEGFYFSRIYKVFSDGGTEIALTNDSLGGYRCPQWSPEGNWIVYSKFDATGYSQIYKVPASGGKEIALTSDSYHHENPQWSPDGNWIVYQKQDATQKYQIYKNSPAIKE